MAEDGAREAENARRAREPDESARRASAAARRALFDDVPASSVDERDDADRFRDTADAERDHRRWDEERPPHHDRP